MNWLAWLLNWRTSVRQFSDTFMQERHQLNLRLMGWLPTVDRSQLTLLLSHHPHTFLQLQDRLEAEGVEYELSAQRIDADYIESHRQRYFECQPKRPSPPAHLRSVTPTMGSATSARSPAGLAAPLGGTVSSRVDRHQGDTTIANASSEPGPWSTDAEIAPERHPRALVILGLVDQLVLSPPAASAVRKHSLQGPSSVPNPQRSKGGTSDLFRVAALVAERHYLRERDRHVLQFLQGLACPAELGYFLAFDDSLLVNRWNSSLLEILEQYGMQRDEPLQSFLLDRFVERTQREYARNPEASKHDMPEDPTATNKSVRESNDGD
jgi:hypothetical protein